MVSLFSSPRPVVGICGADADSASVRAMMTQITSAGAIPMFLGNHAARDAAADIQKMDALVVMGNNADIDPASYGEQAHPKTKSELATPEGRARAEYETKLITLALEEKMPYLGVCGGMQRLNQICGGTLHQHVPDLTGNDDHRQSSFGIAPFIPVQPVHIDSKSTLGKIADDSLLSVFVPWHRDYVYNENSMHHQAVKNPGKGLRAVAHSADILPDGSKLIEAIKADPSGPLKDQFILGVQWHPEFSASELGAKIAARVCKEAQEFAKEHNRQHPPGEAQDESIFSNLPLLKEPQQADEKIAVGVMTRMILNRRAQSAGLER